ncbi:MAG: hypothetical protein U0V02_08700 [Anaerolineales bacterium]
MTKFDFTEEELQLNKRGILSERQKQVLKSMAGSMRSSWKSGIWLILFFLVLGTCITGAVFMQGIDVQKLRVLGPQMLAGLCFGVAAIFVIVSVSIFFSFRQAAKLEVAPVLSAEGVISHDSDYAPSAGFRSYYVYFGKKRFSFPDEMEHTFPKGSKFCIYYGKVGQIELIMSFERLA